MTEQQTSQDTDQPRAVLTLHCLIIIAGLCLLGLLPVGALLGIGSVFQQVFLAHLGLLALCVFLASKGVIRILKGSDFSMSLLLSIALVFCLVPILCGLTPLTARDALVHHLAVPRWWVEQELILPISWHEWSFYPMLLNLGYTGLMQLGLESCCSLYHAVYLFLFCAVCAEFCERITKDLNLSYIAFILPLSLPICQNLASTPLVDLGLALYSALSISLLHAWAEQRRGIATGILAFLALGLACGCKYNGFLFAALTAFFLLIYAIRTKRGGGALFAVYTVGAFVSLLTVLPWLVRNATWKSNPFYPMFQSVFGASQPALGVSGLKPIEKLMLLYGESWLDIALMPLRMMLFGQDGNPQTFDGVLSPVLLLFLIPLLFKPFRKQPIVPFLFLICLSYFYAAIFLSSARIRYMSPIYFPTILLCLLGIATLGSVLAGKYRKHIYGIITSLHIAFCGIYSYNLLTKNQAASYLLGNISEEQYLNDRIPEYPLIQYMNDNLPKDGYTYLLLTGNKFYYYDTPVISGGHFSQNTILRWIRFSANTDSLLREFLERQVRYILLHNERTLRVFNDILTNKEKALWNEHEQKYLTLMYSERGYSLWKIGSKAEIAQELAGELDE